MDNLPKTLKIIILLLLIGSVSTAIAEEITFSTGNFAPYHYLENGEIKGVYIEMVQEISDRLGHSAKFVMYPWKRALIAAETGKTDGIVSVYYSEARSAFLYYVEEPLGEDNISIISGIENELNVSDLSDLKDKSILQVRGTFYGPEFEKFKAHFQGIWYCDDVTKQIILLNKRPSSFAIANETTFFSKSKELGLKDKFKSVYAVKKIPIYMAFSKKLGNKGRTYAEKYGIALKKLKKEEKPPRCGGSE